MTSPRPSARFRADTATATGGRTSWTSRFSIGTPLCPIRWARRSTTPREFKSLDLNAVIKDLHALMTDSQEWWPGRLWPLRGGCSSEWRGTARAPTASPTAAAAPVPASSAFAPLNSWPDNANLDKARRLLWPIKQKYGRKISLADLMILAGNVALDSMGFKTFGFAGGRADVWEPEELYWGPEGTWLLGTNATAANARLQNPLGAVQMVLIYVNPEGPNGKPDPVAAATGHRETFSSAWR